MGQPVGKHRQRAPRALICHFRAAARNVSTTAISAGYGAGRSRTGSPDMRRPPRRRARSRTGIRTGARTDRLGSSAPSGRTPSSSPRNRSGIDKHVPPSPIVSGRRLLRTAGQPHHIEHRFREDARTTGRRLSTSATSASPPMGPFPDRDPIGIRTTSAVRARRGSGRVSTHVSRSVLVESQLAESSPRSTSWSRRAVHISCCRLQAGFENLTGGEPGSRGERVRRAKLGG